MRFIVRYYYDLYKRTRFYQIRNLRSKFFHFMRDCMFIFHSPRTTSTIHIVPQVHNLSGYKPPKKTKKNYRILRRCTSVYLNFFSFLYHWYITVIHYTRHLQKCDIYLLQRVVFLATFSLQISSLTSSGG